MFDGGTPQPSSITIGAAAVGTSYSLTPSSRTVTEGNTSITFTISRSGNVPAETIYASTLFDTARSPGDYDGLLNFAVSFSSGQTSRTFTVGINEDSLVESTEHFRVMIGDDPADQSAQALDISDIYITDDDAPVGTSYSLTPSSTTVTEGNTSITFTITRSGDKPAETIYASTLFDTASSPGDYDGLVNYAVSFSDGETSETFTVSINEDSLVEPTERFRVMIGDDPSDQSAQALDTSEISITDDDTPVGTTYSLTPASTTVVEGNTSITFTITRTGNTSSSATIYASTLFDTASSPGDYVGLVNRVVSFAANDATETFTVTINEDSLVEGTERFRVMIGDDPSDQSAQALDISEIFITDDDGSTPGPIFTITPASTSVTEGSQLVFTITRSGSNLSDQIVYFSTWQDTATFNEGDYQLSTGGEPLNFPIHFVGADPTETVTLSIRQDNQPDAGERFRAIVQGNPPASDPAINLAQTAFITITEGPPQNTAYELIPSATSIVEGNLVTFTITRNGDKPAETVYFSTITNGTAAYSEGDYTLSNGGKPENVAISFLEGQTQRTVSLLIREDGVSDTGETFRAIIQADDDHAASTYLARSTYVLIADVPQIVNPDEPGTQIGIQLFSAKIAHAGELTIEDRIYLPFASGVSATVEQAPGGGTSHNEGTALTAIDFGVPFGTEVRAMAGGYIVNIESDNPNALSNGIPASATVNNNLVPLIPGYDLGPGMLGNFITIKHHIEIDGEVFTFYATYAHLDPSLVNHIKDSMIDKYIPAGTTIGFTGRTGAYTGPHLHVQIGWSLGATRDGRGIVADGEDSAGLMEALKFAETDMAWPQQPSGTPIVSENDPRSFAGSSVYNGNDLSNLWQQFVGSVGEDFNSLVNITASGADAVVTSGESIGRFILDSFEDIRIIGHDLIDRLILSPLFGTTIRHNTIYFDGGAGNDELYGLAADRRIVAEGGVGDDSLTGGSGDDSFDGGAGNDILVGGLGADSLTGGAGADNMTGGLGNDSYFVDNAADRIVEDANEGTQDRAFSSVSYGLAAGVHVEILSTDSDTGTSPISLAGNELNNVIRGNAGNNWLYGMAGVDELVGLRGDDNYAVDNPLDRVIETVGGGRDTVFTTVSYALAVAAEIEILSTTNHDGTAAINLTGNAFAQEIWGNAGANVLNGGGGADWLFGGSGNDRLLGGDGNDHLYGDAGADYLVGMAGNDRLFGDAGAANQLQGGTGDDWYYISASGDSVLEYAGEGTDRIYASVSYVLGAGRSIESIFAAGPTATTPLNFTGNALGQVIWGNAGANILTGGGGVDTLIGGVGNDRLHGNADAASTLVGGTGDDFYYVSNRGDSTLEYAGEGIDRIYASVSYVLGAGRAIESIFAINPTSTTALNLTGNALGQVIWGNAGTNILIGGGGADTLIGGAGNDTLYGNADANSTMQGGTGDDWYYISRTGDSLVELAGQGHDRILSSVSYVLGAGREVEMLLTRSQAGTAALNLTGNEFGQTVLGNNGANTLSGGGGADQLGGYGGADILLGGDGADQLNGGTGNDILNGGAGADRFIFADALGPANVDRIQDFAGGLDRIFIDNAVFAGLANGALAAGAFRTGSAALDADDRIVYNPVSGALLFDADGNGAGAAVQFAVLSGVPALAASDFTVI